MKQYLLKIIEKCKYIRNFFSFKMLRAFAVILITLYSSVWISLAYIVKQQIASAIDYNNKNRPSFSVNYSGIDMSGYPFSIKANINDAKVAIDSSEAAKFIASIIENPDDPFPKLVHRQVYSALDKPIVLSKNIFQRAYKVTIPKEVLVKHSFEGQRSLNLIYRFNSSPQIFINRITPKDKKDNVSQKLIWLSELHDFTLSVPSYQLRELDGDNLMVESQGVNLSIHSAIKAANVGYHISYNDLGTRCTDEIGNLIEPLMHTVYFQHLARTMPMQYQEIGYVNKYTKAGENKMNVDGKVLFQLKDYDDNGDLKIDAQLLQLNQSDDYGSLNGTATAKILFNANSNEFKLDHQAYFAASLRESWHNKWLNSIERAFNNINADAAVAALQDKLKMFLPKVHNYQYATLGYKFSYDGDSSFNLKSNQSHFSIDHFKVQTDKFAITAKKGSDFGDDLRKLPLNFMIKIHNYPKILQIGTEYLQGLIQMPGENSIYAHDEKVIHDFSLFLGEVKHKDSLCTSNWNGQLKFIKGEWYLGDYRLSAIQSIILSIALKS